MRPIDARVAPRVMLVVASLMISGCGLYQDDWRPSPAPPQLRPPLDDDETDPADKSEDPPDIDPDEPLRLTVEQAVLTALENNRELQVERMAPEIRRTFIEQELAAFDPVLFADVHAGRERTEPLTGAGTRRTRAGAEIGLSRELPTGTALDVEASTDKTRGTGIDQRHATRVGLTVTQALLAGGDVAANLANVRQARVDQALSAYEFRGFAEGLVAEVETTYWQLVLAVRREEIVAESLRLAERQLEDTRRRIRVGQIAETEIAAAEAEVALRREALINARSRISELRVRLLRLVYPQAMPSPRRKVIPETEPTVPPMPLEDLPDHVEVALKMRPELREAELLIQKGELEVVKTRDGLLPRMDLFISMGRTGYAESFGRSVGDIADDGYDVFAGISFQHAPHNRARRARHDRATLTVTQRQRSLENLRDLIRQDVELALIEVSRARQQVDATEATRKAQEETARVEAAKFRVGQSTALLVASAQRDLLQSRVAEVEALTKYINARIALYRAEGSLLARRGLAAEQ